MLYIGASSTYKWESVYLLLYGQTQFYVLVSMVAVKNVEEVHAS